MKLKDIHWADFAAKDVIKRSGLNRKYTCASGTATSGIIHIGNFRELITMELVAKALERKRKNVRAVHYWDDYDRFRKVPVGISKSYEKYIGMPVCEIPDPFKCHKSYSEHFINEFEKSIKDLDFNIEFIKQSELYKKCKYAEQIKKALNNKNKIIKILNKYRKEPLSKDWWPLNVYCEKCKKDSTRILEYDGKYKIGYECDCGYSNMIDFRKKGIVKFPWRVQWPAWWIKENVDFEAGGKDLYAAGGSRITGEEIIKKVWNKKPPYGFFYEWVNLKGGKQFSSSLGVVVTVKDLLEIYEPEIIKYLFISTRPNVGFSISFDLDVLKIYEDFDDAERIYFKKSKKLSKKEKKQKRNYELSSIKIPKKLSEQVTFRHLTVLTQLYEGNINQAVKGFKSARIKRRARCAWNWIQKYAPEDMKFKVHEKISKEVKKVLSKRQKEALKELYKRLTKKYTEKSLFNEFYKICKKIKIKNTEFFEGAYLTLIGKKKGPKLAPFILILGKERVRKLLKQLQ